MSHLSEEALLLSVHHRERLLPRQRRHLDTCSECHHLHDVIKATLDASEVEGVTSLPAWSRVSPQLPRKRDHRRMRAWSVAALGIALAGFFVAWPWLVWRAAPPGPTALRTYLTARPVSLRLVTHQVQGQVTVRANRRAGWVLLSYRRVTPLPLGQVYEAWWVQNGRHITAGVFRIHGTSQTVWLHTTDNVAHASAMGITIEPAPGTSSPTGVKTFLGTLP